jgi:hypothetical protein
VTRTVFVDTFPDASLHSIRRNSNDHPEPGRSALTKLTGDDDFASPNDGIHVTR